MKNQHCHSGAGRNPACLFNRQLGFAFATKKNGLINWIPACAGMTKLEVSA